MTDRGTVVASDGTKLAYWTAGASTARDRTLLLLHGGASNHTRWSEYIEHTRLIRSWRILAPDLRGCGASMTRGTQDLPTWCADQCDLLDAEQAGPAVVVGHSFGAQIATHLAATSPRHVRGLVLLDPVFQAGLKGRQAMVRRHRWFFKSLAGIVRAANALGLYRRSLPYNDLRSMDEQTRQALAGDTAFEEIARRYSALGPILRYTPVANYLRQALATVSPLPDVSAIAVPVLVLLCGGTTLADLSVNEAEAARFPNVDTRVLDANHWPLTETPDAVRTAIDDWVDARFPAP